MTHSLKCGRTEYVVDRNRGNLVSVRCPRPVVGALCGTAVCDVHGPSTFDVREVWTAEQVADAFSPRPVNIGRPTIQVTVTYSRAEIHAPDPDFPRFTPGTGEMTISPCRVTVLLYAEVRGYYKLATGLAASDGASAWRRGQDRADCLITCGKCASPWATYRWEAWADVVECPDCGHGFRRSIGD